MATYLLTWVQEKWSWKDFDSDLAELERNGRCEVQWSCGRTKRIEKDDRVFLMKLGSEPRGIVASGWAMTEPYYAENWNKSSNSRGRRTLYVGVDFDTLLPPSQCFPFERLAKGIYSTQLWSPQASGISIKDEVAESLEADWASFLNRACIQRNRIFPNEESSFIEGSVKSVMVNSYERNPRAREACINHFGSICSVCEFDFQKMYGEIGRGFIHVHHLKELSEIREQYTLNPLKDLRPVCPNCHAMLHKQKPAYSIDEMKSIIRSLDGRGDL